MYTFLVWFSDTQTIYYATFLKTKGKDYIDIIICYCYRGRRSCRPVADKCREGWKGKMKLRFVKFLTSRENEIEKKEEEGPTLHALLSSQLGRGQSHLSRSYLLLPPSFTISLHPAQLPRTLRRPAPPPPRTGRAIFSSYPLSSCSASPFLLHKITEATERGGRGTQLADPAVLLNDNMRVPSSPHPCPRWPACSPPFSLSPVSRCGPSTSSEAIGKQSPKIRFPVPSPSLTNK